MADAALGAFFVQFMQSPSFLDFQRTLQVAKQSNNVLNLFGITQQILSANQKRNLLDAVPLSAVLPIVVAVVEVLRQDGHLEPYRCVGGDPLSITRNPPALPGDPRSLTTPAFDDAGTMVG